MVGGMGASFAAAGQRWPFKTIVAGFADLRGVVEQDIFNRPIRLTEMVVASRDDGMGSAVAYLYVWDKGDIEAGVDPPEIVIPIQVGVDPSIQSLGGIVMSEDGVAGIEIEGLTLAVNAVADENDRQIDMIAQGPVMIALMGFPL